MEFNKCKAGGTMSVNKYNFVLNHLTPTLPPPSTERNLTQISIKLTPSSAHPLTENVNDIHQYRGRE